PCLNDQEADPDEEEDQAHREAQAKKAIEDEAQKRDADELGEPAGEAFENEMLADLCAELFKAREQRTAQVAQAWGGWKICGGHSGVRLASGLAAVSAGCTGETPA